MKGLESLLRKLPLKAPTPNLDQRVLAQKPELLAQRYRDPRRVPAWSMVAMALIMAVVGFAAGVAWRSGWRTPQSDRRPPVLIQVIYDSPASRNPFDFTCASHFFPAHQVETTTRELKTTI